MSVITAKYASICPDCGAPIQPGDRINWERGRRATHATCPTIAETPADQLDTSVILNSPARGIIIYSRPDVGSPVLLDGATAAIVTHRRWISRDMAEDFDWFDISEAGGAWEVGVRSPATDAERAACQAVEEEERQRQEKARQERERKLAEQAAAAARVVADDARLKELLAAIPAAYLATDYLDFAETGWTNTPGAWELVLSSSTAGWHDGTQVWQHTKLPIALHAFGNRIVAYAPAEHVRRWLAKAVEKYGVTPEKAQEWLAKYRGCVGTELYSFAAGEELSPAREG